MVLQFLRFISSSSRRLSFFPFSSYKPQNGMAWIRMLSAYASSAEGEFDEIQDDNKTSEKATALHSALLQLEGDFCKESRLPLQHFFGARRTHVIPTGSLRLDLALGLGGLPKVILYKVITLNVFIPNVDLTLMPVVKMWSSCGSDVLLSKFCNPKQVMADLLYVQRAMDI